MDDESHLSQAGVRRLGDGRKSQLSVNRLEQRASYRKPRFPGTPFAERIIKELSASALA
jgi:hypothetical protein